MVRFEAVTLAGDFGDEQGVLVFVDDSLFAVLSRLGEIHGELQGQWYIEAYFGSTQLNVPHDTFATLEEAELRLAEHGGGAPCEAPVR
jgi:hypothetical protein